jgi:hypothetical protein
MFSVARWRYHTTNRRFCEIDSNGLQDGISKL